MTRLPVILLLICMASISHAQLITQHQLHIVLDPNQHKLSGEDFIVLPSGASRFVDFELHRNMHPISNDAEISLIGQASQEWKQKYRATLPINSNSFTVTYSGEIFHPQRQEKREARVFENTQGTITLEGVVLTGESGWYPQLNYEMQTFLLNVETPTGWKAISQGRRIKTGSEHAGWEESQPQREIYLIAAQLSEYGQNDKGIELLVYLRKDEPELAQKYLEATAHYLDIYERLIGPYPYAKFALVENFWETGYGMPSFTLMGSQVIRLPFIIDSSYPHEILHNWWGNGVYVDYRFGNWSEGMTAYLADHLLKEKSGGGAEYRRNALQKYADYVSAERDFPLAEFSSRNSTQSEAVGYSKSMMLFHMLRRRVGDKNFLRAIKDLYRNNKFKLTSFNQIEKTFTQVAGEDLSPFFTQWTERSGAPMLQLVSTKVNKSKTGYELEIVVEQTQPGYTYDMDVPLAITLSGKEAAYTTVKKMSGKRAEWRIPFEVEPVRVDIDPEFDLFRRLDDEEIPLSLSKIFGAEKLLIVLPQKAGEEIKAQYSQEAKRWQQQPGRTTNVVWDNEIERLPGNGAVWLFGWENKWLSEFQAASASNNVELTSRNAIINGNTYTSTENPIAIVAQRGKASIAWLAAPEPEKLATLARKLPHYGKYSYAVFSGTELTNQDKGAWTVTSSPLAQEVGKTGKAETPRGRLTKRSNLLE